MTDFATLCALPQAESFHWINDLLWRLVNRGSCFWIFTICMGNYCVSPGRRPAAVPWSQWLSVVSYHLGHGSYFVHRARPDRFCKPTGTRTRPPAAHASLPCSFSACHAHAVHPSADCAVDLRGSRDPSAASGSFLQPPLRGPRASTTCRAPQRGADRISSSLGGAGPTSSFTLFQTQGRCPLPPALLVGTEFDTPLGVWWTTTSSRRPKVRSRRSNPRTLALVPCLPLDPASDLTFRSCNRAFAGAAGGRLDRSAGRPRWWPASTAAVAPAARPRRPRRLRALDLELDGLPGWAPGAALGPRVDGVRGR